MTKIALLTSGGDAPGMNAAVRAIVHSCQHHQYECIGFFHGYNGLLNDEWQTLTHRDVSNVLQFGGTLLKSARCPAMCTPDGPKQAANTLRKHQVDALIVIGGDGSFRGLEAIKAHWQGLVIGLPGTIDNDLAGSDNTIGFATAVTTATHAIDKIRDTANAFERVFIVEVMGRHSGHIAFNVGLATGAEAILSFENCDPTNIAPQLAQLIAQIRIQQQHNHESFVIVLAENLWPGGPEALKTQLSEQAGIDSAVCVLGHIQRGGSPAPEDRLLATELGLAAVNAVANNRDRVMIGKQGNQIQEVPLSYAISAAKPVDGRWVEAHSDILTEYLIKHRE
ncbi:MULTISPECIES: ATP-dependent 6-phosphofructokinase [unclassified Pseudoalteromonas]|uniref:ATP-dependent 6-phosphofructokinase n=1 Tax=unclassified Pseudoalteromonas TaxID=194690 RepID=UPI002097A4C6|nr:ATP-dependent 6-phosphofructokinase [Pseudoalteromonas sp. XMcav2-N]MCO7186896.1 ATP-dependent 6-phosphofructokinase [Pseudoalteromonas sp. XMcav2-N]